MVAHTTGDDPSRLEGDDRLTPATEPIGGEPGDLLGLGHVGRLACHGAGEATRLLVPLSLQRVATLGQHVGKTGRTPVADGAVEPAEGLLVERLRRPAPGGAL